MPTIRSPEDGDLPWIDSECGPHGGTPDITRTLPVGGRFSTRQRDIYDVALAALRAGVACVAPGRSVPGLAAWRRPGPLSEGLGALGLMHGDVDEAVAAGAHVFFSAWLGHMLGLDVNDMESLGEDRVGYDRESRRSPLNSGCPDCVWPGGCGPVLSSPWSLVSISFRP